MTREEFKQIWKDSSKENILNQYYDDYITSRKWADTINKAIEKINDYKIYCKENKGLSEYTDIEIEAIEPILIKIEDILKEVSE